MSRIAIVELHKGELKFSAGHFMIFSETRRESMHGHDYQLHVRFNTLIKSNGMAFDLREYKLKLIALCEKLDYRFVLPSQSEFLSIKEDATHYHTHIGQEKISFLKKDAVVLPVVNVTMEELSNWFLSQLMLEKTKLLEDGIQSIMVTVFNGRDESGASVGDIA